MSKSQEEEQIEEKATYITQLSTAALSDSTTFQDDGIFYK